MTFAPPTLLKFLIGTVFSLLLQTNVLANTDCDDVPLDEAQSTQKSFCIAHPGCAFVFSIIDSCTRAKSFLKRLGVVRSKDDLTLANVETAVRESSTSNGDANLPGAANLWDCLPPRLNKALCRQFLGVDQPLSESDQKITNPTLSKEDSNLERLYQEGSALMGRYEEFQDGRTMKIRGAVATLAQCASSKPYSDRATTCNQAQSAVNACEKDRQEVIQRRNDLTQDARKIDASLGSKASARQAPFTGTRQQILMKQALNDFIFLMARDEPKACPSTLPNTTDTPKIALEKWALEDRAWGTAKPKTSGFGAELAKSAVSLAESERSNLAARQARLANEEAELRASERRAEQLRSERGIGSQLLLAATQRQADRAISALESSAQASAAQRSANALPSQSQAAQQADLDWQRQQQSNAQAKADFDRNKAEEQRRQEYLAAQAANDVKVGNERMQRDFAEQRQREVDQINQEIATRAKIRAEESRKEQDRIELEASFYPSLHQCGMTIRNANGTQCAKNLCDQTLEFHFTGGMTGVGAGLCYPMPQGAKLTAVCNRNNSFNQSRGMCKR
jgi:hypothetical protein